MRTTVTIDDALLARTKDEARQQGRTLGEVIEDALRLAFSESRTRDRRPTKLPVFAGGTGLRPGIEPTTRGLLAALDEDQPLDQLQ
ncbi:MAG: ribbon-helix-helix protein, CopG family [Acidimicrobiales bacterium]